MISILAPSKTMDVRPLEQTNTWTEPYFRDKADRIVSVIKRLESLKSVMSVSDSIAKNVEHMYDTWGSQTKPSVYMYKGDVYKGFYAETLGEDDLDWAQSHMLIASGLYGLLRPFDQISQYRLEMKAPLRVNDSNNLYEFWGNDLAHYADTYSGGNICMLVSEEYGKPIRKHATSRIVTPVFMDHKPNGTVGTVPIYSKMMRGVMARWIIDNRIDEPDRLRDFTGFEYLYDTDRSTQDAPVFVREVMTPLQF